MLKKNAARQIADTLPVRLEISLNLRLDGLYVDELASFLTGGEHNCSIDEGEQCVVFAHTYVKSGMVHCTTLTLDDISCLAVGTTEDFYSKSFAF